MADHDITLADGYRELLPKHRWTCSFYPANECVSYNRIVLGCYVKGPKRVLDYEQFAVSDLPNDFVSAQDLEAILVNLRDFAAFQRFENVFNNRVGAHAVSPDLV
jgi:hypothetical protein